LEYISKNKIIIHCNILAV